MGLSIYKMLSARDMTSRFVISIWDDSQRAKRRRLFKAGTNMIPPPWLQCFSSETSSLFFDLTLTLYEAAARVEQTLFPTITVSSLKSYVLKSAAVLTDRNVQSFLFCSLFLYHSVYALIIFFDHILTPMWKNRRLDLDLIWSFFFFFFWFWL